MKTKNQNELLVKFKELENKLKQILKQNKINVKEDVSSSEFKKSMKKYIKNVEEAKQVLAEYEAVATVLNALAGGAQERSETVAKSVVDLRKNPKLKNNESQEAKSINTNSNKSEKYEDEIIVTDGKQIVVTKKKKSINSSSQEF